VVGEEWEQPLRWADAAVCVLTSAYIASPWCTAELGIAQSRGSRLPPMRAEPGVPHPLLNSVQYLDMTVDAAGLADRLSSVIWPAPRARSCGLRTCRTALTQWCL
jgi:hypothetical protein